MVTPRILSDDWIIYSGAGWTEEKKEQSREYRRLCNDMIDHINRTRTKHGRYIPDKYGKRS